MAAEPAARSAFRFRAMKRELVERYRCRWVAVNEGGDVVAGADELGELLHECGSDVAVHRVSEAGAPLVVIDHFDTKPKLSCRCPARPCGVIRSPCRRRERPRLPELIANAATARSQRNVRADGRRRSWGGGSGAVLP